jgi:hypothetical protein
MPKNAKMPNQKSGRSLARYIVLGVAVVLYIAAGVVYLNWAADYLWGAEILCAIGTGYMALFLVGSEKTCESSLAFLGWLF